MDWVTIAILGTIAIGLVNILDSHLITRRMPSLKAYLLPAGIVILLYSLAAAYLFPLPDDVEAWPLLVTVISAVIRTASIVILLYILKTEEVSRAIPVFHVYPVFVAIMAIPLLGESLSYLQWLAIFIVVAGAIIISLKRNSTGYTARLGRTFFLLLAASLLMAAADVGSKYALDYISFWNMYWLSSLCFSGILLLISLRPHILKELSNIRQPRPTMAILVFNETLAVVGIVLFFWAMETGPVSLVSAITASRPLFVLAGVFILSRISPNFLLEGQNVGRALALRLPAIIMIVAGVAIIYLT